MGVLDPQHNPPAYLQGRMICCVCVASRMSAGVRT